MNYPLKPKPRKNPQVKTALITIGGVFFLILILSSFQSTTLFTSFGFIATPFWKVNQGVHTFFQNHLEFLVSREQLLKENADLKSQISDLSTIALDRDTLMMENTDLKDLKNTSGNNTGEVARVLTTPTQSLYDVIVVELRIDSDVKVGDIVFGQGKVALGTVLERTGTLAHVQLFSSSGVSILAQLEKNGTTLQLVGQGGGNFVFAAPRDLDIVPGDIVVLPSLSTSILGKVQVVEPLRSDSFKNVYISYPINIFNLTFVRISHAH